MNLKTADKIFAAILTLIGVYVVFASWNYGMMRGRVPGPGFFPFFSGLLMTALSATVLFRRGKTLNGAVAPKILAVIAGIVATLLAFVFLAPHVGFTVCAFLLMLAIGWISEETEKRTRRFGVKLTVISFLACAVCHVFFKYVILVNLPAGFSGL